MNPIFKLKRVTFTLPRSQVRRRATQIDELLLEVVGISGFWVSDLSELSHFFLTELHEIKVEPPESLEYQEAFQQIAAFKTRMLQRYGVTLQDEHFDMLLWELVDLLEAGRNEWHARYSDQFAFAVLFSGLTQISYAAPWSWEGFTLDGRTFSIQDHHNVLRIYMGGEQVYVLGAGHPVGYWELSSDQERLDWLANELEERSIAIFFGNPQDAVRLT
jgi:hypothetical protein